ncbi:hypothetical protein XIS1_1580004 [Xenorhabdus innexi]|uniref:Uncharacterized protein n=1 Tax=Xenorhabdus innexi TaxID=290109 RepID=A0A1N6MUR7_9GAMM|nr:hypothetical protein XIS1_1580004 [Xenorhabdus innexi]
MFFIKKHNYIMKLLYLKLITFPYYELLKWLIVIVKENQCEYWRLIKRALVIGQ